MSTLLPPTYPSPEDIAEEQHNQDVWVTTVCVLVGISTLTVFARTIWRQCVIRSMGVDDWWMVIAWIFTVGYLAEIIVLKENGTGHSIPELTLENMVVFLEATLAVEVTYYVIVYAIKVSIVYLYLRIVVSPTTRRLCYGTIAVLTAFVIICVVVTLVQCTPFAKIIDVTRSLPGTCINTTAFFYTTSAFNIITDLWILYLPVQTLWSIQRPAREKLAICLVFAIGLFSTIASIIRLHTIYKYTLPKDPFRDGIDVNLWSMIEVNVGMICASLPPLRQVLNCGARSRTGSSRRYSSAGSGSGQRRWLSHSDNASNGVYGQHPYGIQKTQSIALTSIARSEDGKSRFEQEKYERGIMGLDALEGRDLEGGSTERIIDPRHHYQPGVAM